MPMLENVLLCGIAATLLCTCVGLPLGRLLASTKPVALAMAPALGWAVFNAASLPVLLLTGFSRSIVALLYGAALVFGLAASLVTKRSSNIAAKSAPNIPCWAYGAAALLALGPAIAILPKLVSGGVMLAAEMYDHSKIAIIDDIVRLGLPPGNPVFGAAGAASPLAYYYLWHCGAAIFSVLLNVSGWEADIALTWFTGFASLSLMMGVAVWIARRSSAAIWVVLLSVAMSLRPVLSALFGKNALETVLPSHQGLQSWVVQASWSPQHLAAASCVVLAVLLIARLAGGGGFGLAPVLALVVAAGFESSAWVGGITFAVAATILGPILLFAAAPGSRLRFAVTAGAAAILAVSLAFPLLRDEYIATAARASGAPIAFSPYEALGPIMPSWLRHLLDLPGFWLVALPIQFPAIYLAGSIALTRVIAGRATAPDEKRLAIGFAVLTLAGFTIAWLLVSTIANNDLGWRAILPGVLALTAFAAAGLSQWIAAPAPITAAAAIGLFLLGVPDGIGFIAANATGIRASSDAAFARSPELWAAVRRHAAPGDRVADNPLYLADMVRWPINISWALFADRRSCFANWDLARAFVALPMSQIDELEILFERVFAGNATPAEVRSLATSYDCRVIVVTPSDGAWSQDDFAAGGAYRLVEEKAGAWRIYVASDP